MTESPKVCPICKGEKTVWRGGQGGDYEPCACAKPRWASEPRYGGRLVGREVQARQMAVYQAGALKAVATEIVESWKRERGLPLLSPEACRQLVDKIEAALVAERGRQP